MSSRLDTTPWFTKNLAGGWLGTGSSSVWDGNAAVERRKGPGYDRAMLLAIDIGNTNVTIGSFRNGALVATRRAATVPRATADDLEALIEELLRLDDAAIAD